MSQLGNNMSEFLSKLDAIAPRTPAKEQLNESVKVTEVPVLGPLAAQIKKLEEQYASVKEGKLDDLKDKKAEKDDANWWDKKDSKGTNKRDVKGSRYGGSKQKDDEDKDELTESMSDNADLIELLSSASTDFPVDEDEANQIAIELESQASFEGLDISADEIVNYMHQHGMISSSDGLDESYNLSSEEDIQLIYSLAEKNGINLRPGDIVAAKRVGDVIWFVGPNTDDSNWMVGTFDNNFKESIWDAPVGTKEKSSTGGTTEKTATGIKHTSKKYGGEEDKSLDDKDDLDEAKEMDPIVLAVKEIAKKFFGKPHSAARIQGGTVYRMSIPMNHMVSKPYRYTKFKDIAPKDIEEMKSIREQFLDAVQQNGIDPSLVEVKYRMGAWL